MCGGCPGPDLFLPKQTRSRPEKKKRLPHPFQGITMRKNGKGYCRNQKQKDVSTQFLSASEFLEELLGYVSNLSREDCCVSVQGVARKCECIKFLADKPSIAKVVALGLKKYFDLIFGVACPAEEFMNTYNWEESIANRGADNIISCLYLDLGRRGVIGNTGRPLKHLTIAADNCSGQNKNKAMIKFCDSDSPTIFRRQEYRDADAEEFDLFPTSRSKRNCVGLSANERAEDLQNLPDCLDTLPPPGLSAEKANECQNKLRPFAPTEEAKEYYNRMTPDHQAQIDLKKAAKNKTRTEKKKTKKAKISEANKDNR